MDERQRGFSRGAPGSVLITGGSGFIGRRLTSALLARGYHVAHLSRAAGSSGQVKVHAWDPGSGVLDPGVFGGIDYLVHLAGANLGEKRWTRARKEEIIRSRVETARLLYRTVSTFNIPLKAYITASAVGYYGTEGVSRVFTEDDPPSAGYLGSVCSSWEEGAGLFAAAGIRSVILRTAVVLDRREGILPRLTAPAQAGLVVRLGNGRQVFPWIHAGDLAAIYEMALARTDMTGAYNAVAPEIISHDEFMKTLARVMERRVFLPNIPSALLRLFLGEMSQMILEGSAVSPERLLISGFRFRFEKAQDALTDLFRS